MEGFQTPEGNASIFVLPRVPKVRRLRVVYLSGPRFPLSGRREHTALLGGVRGVEAAAITNHYATHPP